MNHEPQPEAVSSISIDLSTEKAQPEVGSIVEVTAYNGQKVCLARLESGGLIAFESRCPHRGVPLCHGRLQAGQIICLEHFWRWQALSGEPLATGQPPLLTFRIEEQDVSLRLLQN